ncbi:PP2C family protein-serine/threonine phosphatase, partial [Klebsiella pneumoniae]|uniref:PP2C family protein-serine/threonine phosphatase n=1 Tax=Klebsiella pneumoniae TaxID=573 RepID=UPI0025A0CFA3
LDTTNGILSYSNAGHNYPLWWQSNSEQLETLYEHGILLGVVKDVNLDNHQIEIKPGDFLILYTDGI